MQVWNVLHAARWNTGCKNYAKNRLRTIAQICCAICSQLRHISTIGRKLVKQQYLLHKWHILTIWWTSAHWRLRSVREFVATNQISTGFASWLRCCTNVAQWRSTKLCTMFGRLLVYGSWAGTLYIHFLRSCPVTEFCQVQSSLCVQVAFSYIVSVTIRHSSSGRQQNFAAWYIHATGRPFRSTLGGRTV